MKKYASRLAFFSFLMLLVSAHGSAAYSSIDINHESLQQSIAAGSVSEYLESLYQHQLDNGVRNFIPFSLLLITTSRQLLSGGETASALVCSEYADRLSPDLPAAAMNRHYVAWRANRLMVHQLVYGLAISFPKIFFSLDDCAYYAFKQLAILGAALMITLAGIGIISLVRNSRLFMHDLCHVMPKTLSRHGVIALFILLCILPLLLGLSLAWLFPYWLMLFWSYHNVRERAFIGIAVVGFVFVVPLIAICCSYFLFMPQCDVQQRLWQANYGYHTKYELEDFVQYALRSPDDYELMFSAGLVNKREQNYATALRFYGRLLKKNPSDYKVCTNAGNVYFAMGDWDHAVEMYKAAIAAAPDRCAAAYFNLARAYQQKFMFKDAEQSLSDAKRLDSLRVETYLDIYSENYNRLLMDETISRTALWKKGLGDFFEQRYLMNSVWNIFFSGWLRLPYGTLAILALLLLNLVYSVNDSVRIAAQCTLCGRVMCPRCQRNIAADILCFQCQNFLKKQDQLSYKQKDAKKVQIYAHIRLLRRWASCFSIVLPGMAHMWKGRIVLGSFLAFTFFWLLLQVVFVLFFRGSWYDLMYDRTVYGCLYAVLTVAVWLVLRSHIRSVKSPDIEDNVALMSLGLRI